MPSIRTMAWMGVLWLATGGGVAANGLESTGSWRWGTWSHAQTVASLRWGALPWGDARAGLAPKVSILTTQQAAVTSEARSWTRQPSAPEPLAPVIRQAATAAPPATTILAAPPKVFVPVTADPVVATLQKPTWILRTEAPIGATTAAYHALVNLGSSGFANEAGLTSGGALPWYLSPVAQGLYGGTPNTLQRAEFAATLLKRVEAAFVRSGLSVSLTADLTQSAAHTLSVVSNTQSPANPNAVGVTEVGRDGFTFIDKLSYASTIDELNWAVAHNVAHELMHAFGVDGHDPTGGYLDSAVADWQTLVSPDAVFSPSAIRALSSRDFFQVGVGGLRGAQELAHGSDCLHCLGLVSAPVPEPATVLIWGFVGGMLVMGARRRSARTRV